MNNTAIIIGASGLTGSMLSQLLLNGSEYDKVISFVRKSTKNCHLKLQEHIIDFDNLGTNKNLLHGDDMFCCLGTTIKKAGSQSAFEKVDLHYPIEFARIAKMNGVKQFLVISSLGANSKSSNFYMRTKGRMEEELKLLNFESLSIFQPSLLLGDRREFRLGEKIGSLVIRAISPLFIGKMRKYRAIKSSDVALAMYTIAQQNKKDINIYESDEIHTIAHK